MRGQVIFVIVEGETEEAFIKRVVAPSLSQLNLFLKPKFINHDRGGAINYDRLCSHLPRHFHDKDNAVVTTFFDYYALTNTFPGFAAAEKIGDFYAKIECLENALHEEVLQKFACPPDRFFPHIQPHESEALLFAKPDVFPEVEQRWANAVVKLERINATFENPEHINNGYETAPSKRLLAILKPKYQKRQDFPKLAEKITLSVLEQKCPHFHKWMEQLRQYGKNNV